MQIKQVKLTNYRNYDSLVVNLNPGKTILIGENAQGKTNFLEAIEFASLGKASRASKDQELIGLGKERMQLEILFERQGNEESISIELKLNPPSQGSGKRVISRAMKLNGISLKSRGALLGNLVTVSFKSQDLLLLRAGPKHRRDWLDSVILRLRPSFHEVFNNYAKVISQRNRLLKIICEKGRMSDSDNEQLIVWDKQLALGSAKIIKERAKVLTKLLPVAERYQEHISGHKEVLEADYYLACQKDSPQESFSAEDDDSQDYTNDDHQAQQQDATTDDFAQTSSFTLRTLEGLSEKDIAVLIFKQLKPIRRDEIRRKQSLVGPHRDDIAFSINERDALTFASQGQQRSLVLSLKLAELEMLAQSLDEMPILLLDDVLAELDITRQGMLMLAVKQSAQAIITTTHLTGFLPEWLEESTILSVRQGSIEQEEKATSSEPPKVSSVQPAS